MLPNYWRKCVVDKIYRMQTGFQTVLDLPKSPYKKESDDLLRTVPH